ncbi:preprotein translocase subunit SecG [Candidatus Neomarinimicrobiota bacterium]
MYYGFLIFLHIVVSFLLVVVILLQSGKGGGLAGSMGGSVSTAMFGGQGADKLMTRLTTGLAGAFMILAILISLAGRPSNSDESVVQQQAGQQQAAPLQPFDQVNIPEAPASSVLPLPVEEAQPVEDALPE